MDFFKPPLLGRAGFEQKVIDKKPFVVNDDVVSHYILSGRSLVLPNAEQSIDLIQHARQFSVGQLAAFRISEGGQVLQRVSVYLFPVKDRSLTVAPRSATQEEIHSTERTAVNGLQPWTRKALMGRGVLIDFMSYANRHGIEVSHFEGFAITLDQVLAIAAEQKVELLQGDILLLRTGFTTAYKTLDDDQREDIATRKEWCGLGQSRETTRWLWEQQFAAVVSDSPGFEVRRKSRYRRLWLIHSGMLIRCSPCRERMAFAPNTTRWLGHTYRGALRPRRIGCAVYKESTVVISVYFGTTELHRSSCITAECNCCLLNDYCVESLLHALENGESKWG